MKKILEICPYSEGICGVYQRVKQESEELKKRGYDVTIFSSNITKGTNKITKSQDKYKSINIQRFKAKKIIGESFMNWNFKTELIKLNPQIIIVHNYRHLHTTKVLRYIKTLKNKPKIFLVTHAPFVEKNTTRKWYEDILVTLYDKTIGKKTINKFDKIITISEWELPILKKIGTKTEKIKQVPNMIPNDFFKIKKTDKKNKIFEILFLGRIAPVKNLETIFYAIKELSVHLTIIGTAEKEYKKKLDGIIKKEKIKNITFKAPIYNLKDKINAFDSCDLFILPSIREAFPQSLIEAMARGKIVVSSNTNGAKEIIQNKINGFLFKIKNYKELKQIINEIRTKLNKKEKEKIKKEAIKSCEKFKIETVINTLEEIINEK